MGSRWGEAISLKHKFIFRFKKAEGLNKNKTKALITSTTTGVKKINMIIPGVILCAICRNN